MTGYLPYDIIVLYVIVSGVSFFAPPVWKGGAVMLRSAYRATSMPGMKGWRSIGDILSV